ncbi:MAG: hypothetical protein H6726_18685 [Sandaracinaceae bacterium]|nr:hypothetical protein [Sandaracinaceae bacterium]
MRTPQLNWTTLLAPLLGLSGCLQVEAVPVVDAGVDGVDHGGVGQDMGAVDHSASWPQVVYDGQREISQVYACESALLWSFFATDDALGNRRNDEEVWAWEVGSSPQILAANLRPRTRLAGCHDGMAYWTQTDGSALSLHRREMSGTSPAEFVRPGGPWAMGDDGLVTRWLDGDAGVEVFDVESSSMTVFSFDGLGGSPNLFGRATRAYRDHVYVTGDPGGRIALTPVAEWEPLALEYFVNFEAVPGHLVVSDSQFESRVEEIRENGDALTLGVSCEVGGSVLPVASGRGAWVLWHFATRASPCSEVGRSAVDANGNVRVQTLPDIARLAQEMSQDGGSSTVSIRVLQFGEQIAFVDVRRGTIRLVGEPAFPCVDPVVPCPVGAECVTTLCTDLPN